MNNNCGSILQGRYTKLQRLKPADIRTRQEYIYSAKFSSEFYKAEIPLVQNEVKNDRIRIIGELKNTKIQRKQEGIFKL